MNTVLIKKLLNQQKKLNKKSTIFHVGPDAPFVNIQDAINAAKNEGGTIYIEPGIYREDLILYPGITLEGQGIADFRAISIHGTHTLHSNGEYSFNHVLLESKKSIFFMDNSALKPSLLFRGCGFDVQDGYVLDISSMGGSTVFFDCVSAGENNGFINNRAGCFNTTLFNMTFCGGKNKNPTKLFGKSLFFNIHAINPIVIQGKNASLDVMGGSWIEGNINVLDGASLNVSCSSIHGGSVYAVYKDSISNLSVINSALESKANFVIEGEGTVFLLGASFGVMAKVSPNIDVSVGSTVTNVHESGAVLEKIYLRSNPDGYFETNINGEKVFVPYFKAEK